MSFPRPGEYPELEDMQAKEMVLFLGWPDDLPSLIMVLDPLVMQGSELWLYSDVSGVVDWFEGEVAAVLTHSAEACKARLASSPGSCSQSVLTASGLQGV